MVVKCLGRGRYLPMYIGEKERIQRKNRLVFVTIRAEEMGRCMPSRPSVTRNEAGVTSNFLLCNKHGQ